MDENISPTGQIDISIPGVLSIVGDVKIYPFADTTGMFDIPVLDIGSISGSVDLIPNPVDLEAGPFEFDVNSNEVSIVGNTITLNITGKQLLPNTVYKLVFDSGVILDELNNPVSDSDFPPFTFMTQSS